MGEDGYGNGVDNHDGVDDDQDDGVDDDDDHVFV